MNDDDIRALIRTAIAKHLGAPSAPEAGSGFSRTESRTESPTSISFARYVLPRAEDDTLCLIEPAVRCNHCGYCQCHGH